MMVKILLSEAIEIFQDAVDYFSENLYYFDRKTEKFKVVNSEIIDDIEMGDSRADLLTGYDRLEVNDALDYVDKQGSKQIVAVYNQYEINTWDHMLRFAWYKGAPELAEAINGRGAYRIFRMMVADKGWLDEWYQFEQKQYAKEIYRWAQDNDIEVKDDLEISTDHDQFS